MKRYSPERKAAVIEKMMPPHNVSISVLSEETGISQQSLYNWRQKARSGGVVVPGDGKGSEQWSTTDKFNVVLETATLSEAELGEYCRKKGLYVEQIEAWKEACKNANEEPALTKKERQQLKQEQKKSKRLERELKRKEKALAEAAALLVLQKKAQALWEESEDD